MIDAIYAYFPITSNKRLVWLTNRQNFDALKTQLGEELQQLQDPAELTSLQHNMEACGFTEERAGMLLYLVAKAYSQRYQIKSLQLLDKNSVAKVNGMLQQFELDRDTFGEIRTDMATMPCTHVLMKYQRVKPVHSLLVSLLDPT